MHTPILILPIKVELRKIDLEYIKNKAICLENKTHFKKALSHLHFTLPYHLYASSRLFPTTFQDMWLSMLEPKLIISIFKYKSTDLLYYYKHNSQEKVPKTESKVGHPPPPFLHLSLLCFRETKQAGFKTRASDITKQKQIWKVSKPHKPHSHYYCVDSTLVKNVYFNFLYC